MKNNQVLISILVLEMTMCGVFPENKTFAQITQTCASSPIPTGWVVTGSSTSIQCGNFSNNIRTIRRADGLPPNSSLSICASSPIPTGWVVTGSSTSIQCGNFSNNIRTIRRVS
jgi:uncharacterized protein YbdZ (MbtH family)